MAKTNQEHYDEAMNAPNTPRPMTSPQPNAPKTPGGWSDRAKDSYNVTYSYCPDEDETEDND